MTDGAAAGPLSEKSKSPQHFVHWLSSRSELL